MSRASPRRAIVPAAGHGTRMRPITKAIPKEMLPVGRAPVLEHVLAELRDAGIEAVLLVISPGKEMIRTYFGNGEAMGVRCDYVVQEKMLGLGHAVSLGEVWAASEPFVVAHGDTLFETDGGSPLARLIAAFEANSADCAVLCEEISLEKTRKYGIVAPKAGSPPGAFGELALSGIVEKPESDRAPSCLAVAARWTFTPGVFPVLREAARLASGETGLTQTAGIWIASGALGYAVPLRSSERRCDIGGWETYLQTAARAALEDPEAGPRLRREFGME